MSPARRDRSAWLPWCPIHVALGVNPNASGRTAPNWLVDRALGVPSLAGEGLMELHLVVPLTTPSAHLTPAPQPVLHIGAHRTPTVHHLAVVAPFMLDPRAAG